MVLHRYRRHSDVGVSRARLRRVRAWALDSPDLRQGRIRSPVVFSPLGLPLS